MIDRAKILCKCLGGSNLYGLETPASDLDYRGVWISTDLDEIFGLRKREAIIRQKTTDECYYELRHAVNLLRGANTAMIELLFNERWLEISSEWKTLQENKYKLMDSEKLYRCLRGYMQGELKLANGERTGRLGGKRKEAIDRYSFSPKNYVQFYRLAWAGIMFFQNNIFPAHLRSYDAELAKQLRKIKMEPEKFTKSELNEKAADYEKLLGAAFAARANNYKFDDDFAQSYCRGRYLEILKESQK